MKAVIAEADCLLRWRKSRVKLYKDRGELNNVPVASRNGLVAGSKPPVEPCNAAVGNDNRGVRTHNRTVSLRKPPVGPRNASVELHNAAVGICKGSVAPCNRQVT